MVLGWAGWVVVVVLVAIVSPPGDMLGIIGTMGINCGLLGDMVGKNKDALLVGIVLALLL